MDADSLTCMICPGHPRFSDVSHLLTHVSSKAHLSSSFKLQVRSHQDQSASELLERYDVWYKANNLPALLSDRINIKDRKRKRKQPSKQPPATKLPEFLDPRLMEPNPNLCTPPDALPVTPKPTRSRSKRARLSKASNKEEEELDRLFEAKEENKEVLVQFVDSQETPDQRIDEMARLKGIQWPGMDIFDSATNLMRRKRNQKKDGKILKRMEITSAQVEPTEQIFSPEGHLLRERFISGNVDEDSPLKGETPIPKQRPPRPRKLVLQPKNPNLPIGKRPKKAGGGKHDKSDQVAVFDSSRHSLRLTGIQPSYDEDDQDFQLSVQAFAKRPRGGLQIFADSDHKDKEVFKHHSSPKYNPTQDTLTPARLVLDHRLSTPKNLGRIFDTQTAHANENIEPLFTQHGGIDIGWESPLGRRSRMNQPNYPSEFCFVKDEEEEEGEGFCRFNSNPLVAPSPKIEMGLLGDGSYDDFSIAASNWNLQRPQSSEATMSEEDQELARFYLNGSTD